MAYHGCTICKQPIEPDRFKDYPETQLCSVHAEEIEKYGGEFLGAASEEKTSKAQSLKQGYGGGISVTFTRNQEAIDQLRDDYRLRQHGS